MTRDRSLNPAAYHLFDPKRVEWIRLFDGFTLGQARGGDKFAVDLEKSHNHCTFRLGPDGRVRLVDLGSPGGTTINGQPVPFATELVLQENDLLRINGRDLYLTRGRVSPTSLPAKEKLPSKAPQLLRGASLPGRRRELPLNEVQGSPVDSGPSAAQRLLRIFEVFVAQARSAWVAAQSGVLSLKSFREPIVVALLVAALIAWKLYGGRAQTREDPRRELAASQSNPQPASPLEARASGTTIPLPPPSAPDPAPWAARASQAAPFTPIQPAPASVPRGSAMVSAPPPAPAQSPKGELQAASKPRPAFEVIPVGATAPAEAPISDLQPAEHAPPPGSGTDTVHFRITAISVMSSDARKTRFEDYVSAGTVVDAFQSMNQGQVVAAASLSVAAPAATQRFEQPMIAREGRTYRLDWCYAWENSCGKPAADAFCREMGMSASVSYGIASRVGNSDQPTAIIGQSGVLCPGSQPGHPCDGFAYIECGR